MVFGENADVQNQERVGAAVDRLTKEKTEYKTDGSSANSDMENGVHGGISGCDENDDQLMRMLIEVGFQNDYLRAQIRDLNSQFEQSVDVSKQNGLSVDRLHEKIESLEKELQEQRETQKAAENALEHLRQAHTDADSKVQELSLQLVEAQKKMEHEIKERDDKYEELNSKFGKLHKRAKQRIQEIQKEKDELDARFRDVNVMVEQASSQQASQQQELERTRQQASEALRSMDVERQQLRVANNKLRDNIDEMRRSLEAKESTLEGLHQSIFEKEQMLEQTRGLLQAAEEKKQALISELSAKHQKQLGSLEAQLADALSDRSKAAESIASLQIILAEKDSKIAELDAASTGEVGRLGAALEEVKRELINLKDQHNKRREGWEATCQSLRMKLEASESACLRAEIEAAKLRSQLELESSMQNQLLNTKDSELAAVKDEISRLESEFCAYKVRAHALLQKKDAELSAAKDSELIKAQEDAIKEAEREVTLTLAERDKAIQDLHVALTNHDKELAERDAALIDAQQRIRNMTLKADSSAAQFLVEKEAWKKNLEIIEENWRLKYGILEAEKNKSIGDDLQKDLKEIQLQYDKLKEEHDTFRDIADRTIEEKEKEIAKLLGENMKLLHSLESRPSVEHNSFLNSVSSKQDSQILNVAAAEQQILVLARQQAQREEELAQSQRHILALQEEIEELEHENRLHSQQEAMLKAELRNIERSQKREGVDMTYLKNVILKLLETGEVEALLPVVGTLLQFSPEEIRKCQQTYRSSSDASSSAASVGDTVSTQRSLFSRFAFS